MLRRNPWVVAEAALIEVRIQFRARRRLVQMLELRGAPDDEVALVEPLSRRTRSLERKVPAAWVAGADRRFLVATPGGGDVVRFRRVRLVHDTRVDPRLASLRSRPGRG